MLDKDRMHSSPQTVVHSFRLAIRLGMVSDVKLTQAPMAKQTAFQM